nr:MAG TPA: 4Fe-4S dicluster domain protein [Caudoviricetes sp.]
MNQFNYQWRIFNGCVVACPFGLIRYLLFYLHGFERQIIDFRRIF